MMYGICVCADMQVFVVYSMCVCDVCMCVYRCVWYVYVQVFVMCVQTCVVYGICVYAVMCVVCVCICVCRCVCVWCGMCVVCAGI